MMLIGRSSSGQQKRNHSRVIGVKRAREFMIANYAYDEPIELGSMPEFFHLTATNLDHLWMQTGQAFLDLRCLEHSIYPWDNVCKRFEILAGSPMPVTQAFFFFHILRYWQLRWPIFVHEWRKPAPVIAAHSKSNVRLSISPMKYLWQRPYAYLRIYMCSPAIKSHLETPKTVICFPISADLSRVNSPVLNSVSHTVSSLRCALCSNYLVN